MHERLELPVGEEPAGARVTSSRMKKCEAGRQTRTREDRTARVHAGRCTGTHNTAARKHEPTARAPARGCPVAHRLVVATSEGDGEATALGELGDEGGHNEWVACAQGRAEGCPVLEAAQLLFVRLKASATVSGHEVVVLGKNVRQHERRLQCWRKRGILGRPIMHRPHGRLGGGISTHQTTQEVTTHTHVSVPRKKKEGHSSTAWPATSWPSLNGGASGRVVRWGSGLAWSEARFFLRAQKRSPVCSGLSEPSAGDAKARAGIRSSGSERMSSPIQRKGKGNVEEDEAPGAGA